MKNEAAAKFIELMFKNSRLFWGKMIYSSNIANLSILQLQTLKFIKLHNYAQMSDIAAHFHIELPSATSLLNKLVALHLVERQTDEKDRRLVRVVLTKEGNELFTKAMHDRLAHVGRLLSYLTEEEQQELLRLLEKLSERIEKDYEH